MRKIKIMVDKTSYTNKPTQYDVAGIQNRLKDNSTIEEITPLYLTHYAANGYTVRPSILKDGASEKDFQQQEVIYIDIDNKEGKPIITLKEILLKLNNYGLKAFGYYYTFSHCEEYPRFRIIFILNKPITDINDMNFALKVLNSILPNADTSCATVAKLYYGTNGETNILDQDAEITFEDIIRISEEVSNENEETTISNHSNNKKLNDLINKFDIFKYISKEYNNFRISGNIIYFKECPICGHQNCFVIYKKTNTFKCFGANGGQGGNIINYLSITKNISIPQAIDYFKYEILELKKERKIAINLEDILRVQQESLNEINKNLKKYGIYFNSIDEIKWLNIYSENKIKILCPELANYINENCDYLFIESLTDHKVLKYMYNHGVYSEISDMKFKSFIMKFIPTRILKSSLIEETFKLLITSEGHYIKSKELNSEFNIINFKDGLYNVETGKLMPHTPDCKSTVQYNFNYPVNIEVPENSYFNNFINTFTNGDEEIKKFLFQFCGSTISNYPGYYGKSALFFLSAGNTGKTLFINMLQSLIGEQNCTTIDLSDLDKQFYSIKLLGKRLASFNDLSGIKIKNLGKFKMITGGDDITDSRKGKDLIDFKFYGTLIFAGNIMPNWGGDKGDHVFERMIFIEPKNIIPKEKRDKKLLEKILKEKEYIMSLFLNGLKEYIANGFKYDIPKSCLELGKKVMIDNDSVLTFINECTETVIRKPERTDLTTGGLFKLYISWCTYNNNGQHENNQEFVKKILKHLGIEKAIKCFNGNTYYPGIAVTEDALKTYGENIIR